MTVFRATELKLLKPDFDSELAGLIIGLETLRKKQLGGSTPPAIFFQLKEIFHLLESMESARIEGNRTTIEEYIDSQIRAPAKEDEGILEIKNMQEAMAFIEEQVDETTPINKTLILHLHKMTVDGLEREGDKTPGRYRENPVSINGSRHVPPDYTQVNDYMEELFSFINENHEQRYDLLKTAIAHHRFCWIHPFRNGNGRVSRLLTYSMLIRQGFKVAHGRIVNPAAIFCANRDRYYDMLSAADQGTDAGLETWCVYVLKGLSEEIKKIDRLLDYSYLQEKILAPAVRFCFDKRYLNKIESDILLTAIEKKTAFQSGDITAVMRGGKPVQRSRTLRMLRTRNLIVPEKPGTRKYIPYLINNDLMRGIATALYQEGFIPFKD